MKLEIVDYGYSGEGVSRESGKVHFVPLTIKGEKVEVSVVKNTSSFCKCKLDKVTKPSPKRIAPPCPFYGKCGGCSFQHLDYENELAIKIEMLQTQLQKIGYIKDFKIIKSEPDYHYRNKIKMFSKGDSLALNELDSNSLVEIDKCIICKENINVAMAKIQTFVNAKKIGFAIENVIIQNFDDQILVNFVMKKKIKVEYSGLQIMLGSNAGIFVTNKGESAKHVHGLNNIVITGDINQEINVSTFHQVNDFVQKKLYEDVVKQGKDKVVVNAYSGAGYLSAILAKEAKMVYGIELGTSEHKEAERLKEINGIFNLINLNGDCAKVFQEMDEVAPELVILDPPKAGCDSCVMKRLNEMDVSEIIYISCNPSTLVRDLKFLTAFEIEDVQLFDMFPKTSSIETFVKLKRHFEKA